MKLFKGKPTPRTIEQMHLDIEAGYGFGYEWLKDVLDDEGYVTGYFVGDVDKTINRGFILGGIVESDEEYIIPESWIPVMLDTVEEV